MPFVGPLFLICVTLFYCRVNSLNFVRHIWVGNASLKSPQPPFRKGGRRGDFWDCLAVRISLMDRRVTEL